MALVLGGVVACGDDSASGDDEQICNDGLDNDGDGQTDCDDSDCASDPVCLGETDCADGVDNDSDGDTDCADSDCVGDPDCPAESICDDAEDNDFDGDVDCADTDCFGDPACPTTETSCTDGMDNDADGDVDCDDSDCDQYPLCGPTTETACDDGIDNDADGDVDCFDADCDAVCPDTETDCGDGVDNDADGDTDCDDSDCVGTTDCPTTETSCDDNADNDLDGDIDCADTDCFGDSACPTTETDCANGLDDDADGDVDCADSDCAGDTDCSGAGDTCADILACVQGCSDLNCMNTCAAAGCPSATATYNTLQSCVMTNCLLDCMNDPGGPTCLACMGTSCPGQLADCAANTCTAIGETNCSDGLDDDSDGDIDCADSDCAAEPVCSGSGQTCSEILVCAQGCGSDVGCISTCQSAGCQTGQSTFSDLMGCMMGPCFTDCTSNPGGGACTTCLAMNCQNELSQCMSDTCQTGGETDCGDGVDNDNDTDVDCADSDCANDPLCSAATEIVCDDGVDNDNDTDVDCADSDCTGNPACGGSGWTCTEIYTCADSCGTDMVCINDNCRANGCTSSQSAWDDLITCMFGNCLSDCATDPQSTACTTCLAGACGTELTGCTSSTCP